MISGEIQSFPPDGVWKNKVILWGRRFLAPKNESSLHFRIQGRTANPWTAWRNTMGGGTFSELQQENVNLRTNVTRRATKKKSCQKL